jgi:hypothetical protein
MAGGALSGGILLNVMRRFEKSTTEGVVTPKKAGKAEGAASKA